MSGISNWWRTWAPYWEYLEDRHLGIFEIDRLLIEVKSPVLVVGAGQGLIVRHLQNKGFEVNGVDMERQMALWARKRRLVEILQADGGALPLKNDHYQSVIVTTGVIDYIDDENVIREIIKEVLRVLKPGGHLFIAFYQFNPIIERVNKRIGIIVENEGYHLGRNFKLFQKLEKNPFDCVKLIVDWTGQNYFLTALYWTKLGLFLPRELKEDYRVIKEIGDMATRNGVKKSELFKNVPDTVIYRKAQEIEKLLMSNGINSYEMSSSPDCIVVKHQKNGSGGWNKSKILDSSLKDQDKSKWIVKTDELKLRYKKENRFAVDSLNLTIKKGRVFGILGPNGAGKTTTLKLLCGLLKPSSGKIYFFDGKKKNNFLNIIGYVPQELAIYLRLSGEDNLKFFGRLYGIGGDRLKTRVDEVLDIVGLQERRTDLVMKYSSGMMRRLNLAAGLIHKPEIILLDEPTVGIDPQSRNRIFETIERLKKSGVTMLYTTNYMEEANRICDEIAIMDNGRVLIEGKPKELIKKYGYFRISFDVTNYQEEMEAYIKSINGVKDVEVIDNVLIVSTNSKKGELEILEKIKKIAKENEVSLSLRNINEPNLETLFLDLTGRHLIDGATGRMPGLI
ncbi:MAG: ATP-binding cassette domain-containing protein [Planctomycetes bacterium]|nr:ATP-binding cassette domain-containing protein [Planctomycetota bacterium]